MTLWVSKYVGKQGAPKFVLFILCCPTSHLILVELGIILTIQKKKKQEFWNNSGNIMGNWVEIQANIVER